MTQAERVKGAPRKPSEAGFVGRAGAAERLSPGIQCRGEGYGACNGEERRNNVAERMPAERRAEQSEVCDDEALPPPPPGPAGGSAALGQGEDARRQAGTKPEPSAAGNGYPTATQRSGRRWGRRSNEAERMPAGRRAEQGEVCDDEALPPPPGPCGRLCRPRAGRGCPPSGGDQTGAQRSGKRVPNGDPAERSPLGEEEQRSGADARREAGGAERSL